MYDVFLFTASLELYKAVGDYISNRSKVLPHQKVYTLLYHENSDTRCDADVTVFTSLDEARAFMRTCYESYLENSGFDLDNQTGEYHCEFGDNSAVVVDGMDSYNWTIEEHDLTPDIIKEG